MKRVSLAAMLVLTPLLLLPQPARGEGLEEVIFVVTLSGALAAGIEVSWGLDSHSQVRVGLSFLVGEGLVGGWGRVVYLHNVNPGDRLSFYGGGGLSGLLVFLEEGPSPMAFLEAPLGLRYPLDERLSLLGEFRLGFPWLNPLFGKEIPYPFFPIGLTAGVGYSL